MAIKPWRRIRVRRGKEEDYNQDLMKSGELAVTTDTRKLLVSFVEGISKRVVLSEEIDETNQNVATARQNISAIGNELTQIKGNASDLAKVVDGKVDEAILSEDRKYLTLKANGNVVAELGPFAGEGGGGGGGGSTVTTMVLTNTSGWLAKTVAVGTELSVTAEWSSTLDGIATGAGVLRLYVDGTVRITRNAEQGPVSVNLTNYLTTGSRSFRLNLTDSYGNSRDIRYSVLVENYLMASSFDYLTPQSGAFSFPYIPTGEAEKTIHTKIDTTELPTDIVTTSGWQQTKQIPAQSHGKHVLEAWFTVDMDGETIESNRLRYEFIALESGVTTPIITSQTVIETAEQYQMIPIKYQVYTPDSMTSDVELSVDGVVVGNINVDRTEQTWSYRAMESGSKTMRIRCGSVYRDFPITVTESTANIHAVTEDLSLYLTAQGRSNAEEHPGRWQYNLISASFQNFNFVSDGWQLDSANVPVLKVTGDARVTIPYKIFAQDFRSTGKTIEIEFSTSDVMNYDTPIISCMSGGRGIEITSQAVHFASEQSSITTQFKEDEHIRVSFVVEKRSEHRLIYCYINSDLSYVLPYPDDDDFSQINPVDISIGTNDATVSIYCIRVYDNSLNYHQILGNRIADTADVNEMLALYERNDIFDSSGKIVMDKLPTTLPRMIITVPQLPQYKGDKKTCSVTYINPAEPAKSFTAENVQIDVQGTSSQYYPRKNYKLKYKSGFVNNAGETSSAYQLKDDVLPAKVFCMKADFASSDQCNNVEICEVSEMINPYKTPAQKSDELVRQTVAGLPCVIFWNNGTTTQFIGRP